MQRRSSVQWVGHRHYGVTTSNRSASTTRRRTLCCHQLLHARLICPSSRPRPCILITYPLYELPALASRPEAANRHQHELMRGGGGGYVLLANGMTTRRQGWEGSKAGDSLESSSGAGDSDSENKFLQDTAFRCMAIWTEEWMASERSDWKAGNKGTEGWRRITRKQFD